MRHVLPLEVALQRENGVLVDVFLKEGSAAIPQRVYSSVFDEHDCHYPPRVVASLLQANEFVEWATEVQGAGFLLRALNRDRYGRHEMTEKDLLVMIRRLFQIRHDLSSLDASEHILSIVASAASRGHLSLLEYLFSIDAPMPSGILFAKETAQLVHDLTLQGVDITAVATRGDTTLHQVLGRCLGGSRCWTLDCRLCSELRPTLLAALAREVSSFTNF
ncbi:hypothetical protein J3R83DRAFT_11878 [Lanmaoa asiatica]|nr:hypothetical protein J3R83DRAFT_11878 [Lanmaoa asiatica]